MKRRRNGLTIDARVLSKDLGVPVVPMAARRGEGVSGLLNAIEQKAGSTVRTQTHRIKYQDAALETAVETLAEKLRAEFQDLPNARWVALRLLEGDESIVRAINEKTLGAFEKQNSLHQFVQLEAR